MNEEEAALGIGSMRASEEDREKVVVALRNAFERGYLEPDVFEARMTAALKCRRRNELPRLVGDIEVQSDIEVQRRKEYPLEQHPGFVSEKKHFDVINKIQIAITSFSVAIAAWAISTPAGQNPTFTVHGDAGFADLLLMVMVTVFVINVVIFAVRINRRNPSRK